MPNLIVTDQCSLGCPFCFAQPQKEARVLSLENVKALIPFIRSFEHESINLIGGEPTSNPEFVPILEYLLKEGFNVVIFTHGRIPTRLVTQLQNIHSGEFRFSVNRSYGPMTPKLVRFYRKLGHLVRLNITVYEITQNLTHVIEEVHTFRLQRHFRIGLALPIWPNRQNVYLAPETYGTVAHHLFAFIKDALAVGIQPSFDCGFPFCFFDDQQRSLLAEHGVEFASNCGLIPDVGGYAAMPCFPLAGFARPITSGSRWPAVRRQIEDTLERTRRESLFQRCEHCSAREAGMCAGGCAALRIRLPASVPSASDIDSPATTQTP